jgi:AraC-like DNA-binding protein
LVSADAPEVSEDSLIEGSDGLVRINKEELSAIDRYLSLLAEHIGSHHMLRSDRQTLGHLIQQYVKKNLSHKITLTDISRRLHCSTVTLTESFRREFGGTIMQYVLEERMKLARQLLSSTDQSIGIIADRCGFPDVEYFSRCFKQKEGISPSEWRRSHGNLSNS